MSILEDEEVLINIKDNLYNKVNQFKKWYLDHAIKYQGLEIPQLIATNDEYKEFENFNNDPAKIIGAYAHREAFESLSNHFAVSGIMEVKDIHGDLKQLQVKVPKIYIYIDECDEVKIKPLHILCCPNTIIGPIILHNTFDTPEWILNILKPFVHGPILVYNQGYEKMASIYPMVFRKGNALFSFTQSPNYIVLKNEI